MNTTLKQWSKCQSFLAGGMELGLYGFFSRNPKRQGHFKFNKHVLSPGA